LNQQGQQEALADQQFFGTTIEIDAPSMPTIGIKVHRMHSAWIGHAYSHHANSIFVVLAGSGCTEIGTEKFNWAFGDVIAAPMGHRLQHSATDDAVIVELTDEKLMRYCHYYQHTSCE
jgi:gentisate 1,2-dioxygenase